MSEDDIRRIVREELRDMLVPKVTPSPNLYQAPNPTPPRCSYCGLELVSPMGYVCQQPQCPAGLGGVWCQAKVTP